MRSAERPTRKSQAQALLRRTVQPAQRALVQHDVYRLLRDERSLRVFCEHHCFAVWDFMCLLKALQRRLACVDVPWLPPADPEAARIVNEVVVGEECDARPDGGHASHFELYLQAMRELRADTRPVEQFVALLRDGMVPRHALGAAGAPAGAARFVERTLETCAVGELHEIAAEFVLGRENLLPAVFGRIVEELATAAGLRVPTFVYYLERHISVDGNEHGPAGERLLEALCGDDSRRWRDAESAALGALQARNALWNEIRQRIEEGAP